MNNASKESNFNDHKHIWLIPNALMFMLLYLIENMLFMFDDDDGNNDDDDDDYGCNFGNW